MGGESKQLPPNEASTASVVYAQVLMALAAKYHKLLTCLDWKDDLLIAGLRLGRNRFLTNTFRNLLEVYPKYHCTHFASHAALQQLNDKNHKNLVYEHIVPQTKYIRQPCEDQARAGTLTIEFVVKLLQQYWALATVTRDEDAKLSRTTMPAGWDGIDVLARYTKAGINLVRNPHFLLP